GRASMTIAYPTTPTAGRRRTGRPAYQTKAAESSRATPSANAVGGIAARSAGVRLIGAGSHSVNDASATPNKVARTRYVRRPAVTPPPSSVAWAVSTHAAAIANGGISGSMYCGNFDLLSVKNSRGP